MAWSDIWNGRSSIRRLSDKLAGFFPLNNFYGDNYLAPPDFLYRCHYRVWFRPPILSVVSVTNCGIGEDYKATVNYLIYLFNLRGNVITYDGSLAPHATDVRPIEGYFPTAESFLGPTGIGIAVVESNADLAVMHLSHNQTSGVFSAEHFLASVNNHEGKQFTCCGA